jgi:hypothetical protein
MSWSLILVQNSSSSFQYRDVGLVSIRAFGSTNYLTTYHAERVNTFIWSPLLSREGFALSHWFYKIRLNFSGCRSVLYNECMYAGGSLIFRNTFT